MIELDHVSKCYLAGQVTALDNVSVAFGTGEFVVVLGPSGSGKTTLLNIIGALDVPSSGSIRIDGQPLDGNRQHLRRYRRETISFVFQTFNLFPGLTALENVQFALDARGRSHSRTAASEILDQVGLTNRLRHFPHQLSGGEQQRVAIARALATGNPVILADEPTGELDFKIGIQILDLLQKQAQAGKTVLIVTHNRAISQIADRVVELSGGRIIHDQAQPDLKKAVADLSW